MNLSLVKILKIICAYSIMELYDNNHTYKISNH